MRTFFEIGKIGIWSNRIFNRIHPSIFVSTDSESETVVYLLYFICIYKSRNRQSLLLFHF